MSSSSLTLISPKKDREEEGAIHSLQYCTTYCVVRLDETRVRERDHAWLPFCSIAKGGLSQSQVRRKRLKRVAGQTMNLSNGHYGWITFRVALVLTKWQANTFYYSKVFDTYCCCPWKMKNGQSGKHGSFRHLKVNVCIQCKESSFISMYGSSQSVGRYKVTNMRNCTKLCEEDTWV